MQDRQAVASFRRGGQAEQFDRREVIEDSFVRGGGGVVELVDDHHVEVIRRQGVEVAGVQTLDRGEDVIEPRWSRTADPLLAERRVA